MPNRIIKESINESKGLSECSLFAQDLYKRLITYADDYGRFNADTEIMRARLFPRELEEVTEHDLHEALTELVGNGKISLYKGIDIKDCHKKMYGCFPKWEEHQRVRNTRAKCPEPHEEINDWYLRRFVPITLKVKIFERDEFACLECGKSFTLEGIPSKRAIRLLSGALHIDHIVPVVQGGRATEENLRLLCASCNLKRQRHYSAEEIIDFAKTCGNSPQSAVKKRKARPESNPIQSNPNPIQAEEVWEHYENKITELGKTRKKTDNKMSHINARLKDGFTIDQLKTVINNVFSSPFMLGENDRRKMYIEIDNFLTSAEKVEKWLEESREEELPAHWRIKEPEPEETEDAYPGLEKEFQELYAKFGGH